MIKLKNIFSKILPGFGGIFSSSSRNVKKEEPTPATWDEFLSRTPRYLYAGRITRPDQFSEYFGLNPFIKAKNHIEHNVAEVMPIPDESVDTYQSEDVFEHITYESLVGVFNDIYRVLKPNGLFRLSLPDYRFDVYKDRSLKNEAGEIYFDPGGGGEYVDGKVVGGGHVWFPTYENVLSLINKTAFKEAKINFLHYNTAEGSHTNLIDYGLGFIIRTPDHDPRAQNPYRAISIVVDLRK